MTKIIAALALLASTSLAARADPADWRTVVTDGGVSYLLNLKSIERKVGRDGLPSQAVMLVYRDAGARWNPEGYHVVWFDCRGHFRLMDAVERVETIAYGSVISRAEDAACWGPTGPAAR